MNDNLQNNSLDEQILNSLRENARVSYVKIAKECGVSEGTIRDRVKKYLQSGKIKRFTIESAESISAIIGLTTDPKFETKKILDNIVTKEVDSAYEVTGKFDAVINLKNMKPSEKNKFLEKLRQTEGVIRTETFSVLEEYNMGEE